MAKPITAVFFVSSRRRHTRYWRDWSSDVCCSDLRVLRPRVLVLLADQQVGEDGRGAPALPRRLAVRLAAAGERPRRLRRAPPARGRGRAHARAAAAAGGGPDAR